MAVPALDVVATTDWIGASAQLGIPSGLFVGGEARHSVGRATRSILSSRDGTKLGDLPWADERDVDAAVGAARTAFDTGTWPRIAARERGEILQHFADVVEAHQAELSLLVSLEMGKPIRFCYDGELVTLIRTLRYYGELADKQTGDVSPTVEGELALITREPAGVVAAVVPWNFPLTLAGWKFAPALAAGCTVVLKTSERSPLSMQRVAQLGLEAGLPAGVLNVVSGDGDVAGRRLGLHPDVDIVTFTGSTAVGREFLRYSADSNLKRIYLELGGKSPNIILPDAADLHVAADTAAWAIFFNSGEMCTAGSRLVVHRDVAEEVVERIVATAAEWAPADPLLATTKMGPLVDQRHRTRVLGRIDQAVQRGAVLATGGRATMADTGGAYLEPTVVTGLASSDALVQEEVFGPVLSVQVVRDEEEAIRTANDTSYGLAAALWTSDLGAAHRISRKLRAGLVWVNCYEEGDMNVPFGGVKLSGFGRDRSRHAMDEYTDLKTTWMKY
ncbi:MAG: aldehyde dehydrogenase [Pseudonocardiales bacterium]|nr:aldehyde dehydrogenase [Pseudonocardiales bacterium]